jgi:uncharacterized membrane protein
MTNSALMDQRGRNLTLTDKIKRYYPPAIELIPLGLALLSILYVAYHFGQLPEEIPTHFDINGQPDAWGKKYMLLVLLVIQLYVYMQSWLLNYFLIIKPNDSLEALRFINIPFVKKEQLWPEQTENIRRQMARMMVMINISLHLLFLYIIFGSVQTAYGLWPGLGKGILVLVAWLVIAPGYYIWKAYRAAKPKGQSG